MSPTRTIICERCKKHRGAHTHHLCRYCYMTVRLQKLREAPHTRAKKGAPIETPCGHKGTYGLTGLCVRCYMRKKKRESRAKIRLTEPGYV